MEDAIRVVVSVVLFGGMLAGAAGIAWNLAAARHHSVIARYHGAMAHLLGESRRVGREPHYTEVLDAATDVFDKDPFSSPTRRGRES